MRKLAISILSAVLAITLLAAPAVYSAPDEVQRGPVTDPDG